MSRNTKESQAAFIKWMKRNNPRLYRAALMRMKNNGSRMGAWYDGAGDWFSGLTKSITDLAPKYLQYKQQKKVMKMQIKRAEQGLPPANVADYAPVIKTRIDLAPETRRELIDAGRKSVKDMLWPIGLGIAGLGTLYIVVNKKRR